MSGEVEVHASDTTWANLFPPLSDWLGSRATQTVSKTDDAQFESIARDVVEACIDRYLYLKIDVLMPMVFTIGDIPWHLFDNRGKNALLRGGFHSLAQLTSSTPRDLMDIPSVGRGIVSSVLNVLVHVYVGGAPAHAPASGPIPAGTLSTISSPTMAPSPPATDPVIARVVGALETLAQWHALRGVPEATLLSESGLEGAPASVTEAYGLLTALRAGEIGSGTEVNPARLLDARLGDLNERELVVATRRIFADQPETLDAISTAFSVTRERVRQIEGKVLETISIDHPESQSLVDLAAAVRNRIGLACRLQYLLSAFPGLCDHVHLAGQPAWRVLDRLDPLFEIHDSWAAVPSVASAQAETLKVVTSSSNELGIAPLFGIAERLGWDLSERRQELVEWLEKSGCWVFEEGVLAGRPTILAQAAAILTAQGEPITLDEILSRMPEPRAASSVRNALAIDDRFLRTDIDSWGLLVWGLEEYTSIRDLIAKRIEIHGGAIELELLVEQLTAKFTVAAGSIRSYAAAPPFETVNGIVRAGSGAGAGAGAVLRTPARTKRLYRTSDSWKVRITVNAEHFRGSGNAIRLGVARAIGLEPGESRIMPSRIGDQTVYWTGLQPSLGSIRRYVEALGLSEEQEFFAIFFDNGIFDIWPVASAGTATGLEAALKLVGSSTSPQDVDGSRVALAEALCLDLRAPWASVIQAARDRAEDDLADHLLSVEVLPNVEAPVGAAPSASVEAAEILKLLR